MDSIVDILSTGIEQLLGRASGPLHVRLVMMPTVVTILAIRAHRRDVREGRPTVLGAFVTSPTERRRLLSSGLEDVGKVFVVACVLDTIYQLVVLRAFHPVQTLIVAVACAVVPYALIRGPVTRLVALLNQRWRGGAQPMAATTASEGDDDGESGIPRGYTP